MLTFKMTTNDNIILNKTLFPPNIFEEIINLPTDQLSMFIQIGYQIFKKNQMKILLIESEIEKDKERDKERDKELRNVYSSAVIGANGEEYVANILSKDFLVKNTSKKGYTGDLLVSSKISNKKNIRGNILTEVKNYSNSVPYQEVEKFKRDLRLNSNIKGGLFISLNTKIQNIDESFLFTTLDTQIIPIIYLCSSDPILIKSSIDILWSYIEITVSNQNKEELNNQNLEKINNKISKISDLLNSLSISRNIINETREILQKQLNKIYESVLNTELQIRTQIQSLYKYLQTDSIENQSLCENNEKLCGNFINILEETFPDSLIIKDSNYQKCILEIIQQICKNKIIEIHKSEKRIIFNIHSDIENKSLIVINPLKTKTTININIKKLTNEQQINIPNICKYEDGWVTFQIDKNILKNGELDSIINFIKINDTDNISHSVKI